MNLFRRYPAAWTMAALLACQPLAASVLEDASSAEVDFPSFESSTFAVGLESPWGLAFLPDGRVLVSERPGRLRIISADGTRLSRPIRGLPRILHGDHGGLLDVAVDPDFESNRLIYFSYTKRPGGFRQRGSRLAVARARLNEKATRISGLRVLFHQTPSVDVDENLGGRLGLAADGHLFLTIGDRFTPQQRVRAQDLASHQGKTVRIRTDGAVPADNPFANQSGALPEIWSLGHRNPQGAFVDPRTGALWVAEHGPAGGDEVNLIEPGANYGWPLATFGCEYDTCEPIGETSLPGMEAPLTWWGPGSIAPTNLIRYDGNQFPEWQGNLLVGALAGRAVWRLELTVDERPPRVLAREPLFGDLGERIRDIRQGPDGSLYLLTDGGEARIVRITKPAPGP
ncbi:MAG TPA: PQQ-dependent sugar dehydrogenase [Burkholderiaceae bacterium]|nr:PQQ-dependent sugar dehydrogenase [Burkholderiaceae bacterium]